METKRIILAIFLSFAVLVLWQFVFVKKAPEATVVPQTAVQPFATGAQTETNVNLPAAVPKAAQGTGTVLKPAAESQPAAILAAEGEEKFTVSTPLFTAVWSNKGGVLLSWKLRRHLDQKKEDLELVPAVSKDVGAYPLALLEELDPSRMNLEGITASPLNGSFYKATGGNLTLRDGETGALRFRYADGRGLEVEKTYTFQGGRYDFGTAISVLRDGRPVDFRVLWGPGIGNPSADELKQRMGAGGGVSILAATKVYRVDEPKYKPESSVFNFVNWAAYDDNYFAAIFLPAATTGSASFLRFDVLKTPFFFLAASAPKSVFIGPKENDVLTALGAETKKIVRYGLFGFITEILFVSIRAIHKVIPNWGFAIIVLTFLIKILFFPLTYSSSKSMAKMAGLQPKIKSLRAKYKKSKTDIQQRREMNEEMMKLYKEHGVNPAGGCLPILIQLPVFWGFFRLLTIGIEFRHSPWIFWIKDLSIHDPLYITPLLMGATQFISQKMTPTSADPAQAKMMLIMPVVMTLFFLNFQSGLVLYWLTSNVLQIGQQALINRMMKRKKGETNGKPRKK
jgi:YidC/Oxa1 family membrane protein insertase